jgi:ABC-type glycerol-3-phosphate transport system substrate-binding protein
VRKLHLLLLPAVLLALVVGLAACGGSDESDEDAVIETIETSATSTDAAICGETQTLAFMEQTTGSDGKDAEKACEKETEDEENQPDSVNVSEVEIDGEKATANAEFKGGSLGAQTLELALVEEDGNWKLDEPDGLVNAFAEQIENEPEIEPEVADCLVEGLEDLPNPELESIVIENNTDVFGEIAEGCQG